MVDILWTAFRIMGAVTGVCVLVYLCVLTARGTFRELRGWEYEFSQWLKARKENK